MPEIRTGLIFHRAKLCPDTSNVSHAGFTRIWSMASLFTIQRAGPGCSIKAEKLEESRCS